MRAAVDCPITTSGAAPLIVDGFQRVRRSTFTEGAIMERAEYNRHSRARVAETAKDESRYATPRNAMQHRTRRSASTIGGAAPDTIIGRAAADRAGARPGARPYQSAHQAGWRGAPSRRPHHDNKRSSHFSTKGETLPPTKPANANNALRASPTG